MSAPDANAERPDPNTLPCDECGHVWFAGERPHEYSADGAVVCALCRAQRRLPRQGDR